jgi:Zn-dependent protease with chaperone function
MRADAIENRPLFLRTVWKRNAYLLLLVVLEAVVVYVLVHVRFELPPSDPAKLARITGDPKFFFATEFWGYLVVFHRVYWSTMIWVGLFVLLQIVAAEWNFFSGLEGEGMITLYPEDKSEGQRFGGLTGPEVVQVVQDLAGVFKVRKIDRIVVTRQPDPNAFTAHAFGLWNVVVLHSNLLEVLPRRGVRSVIAHELAHVRRWDSMMYQLVKLPTAFAWTVAILVFLHMVYVLFPFTGFWDHLGTYALRLLFIVAAFTVTVRAFKVLERVANLASQQTELIADSYAAQVSGWLPHINALLLIGERAQALTVLSEALRELPARLKEEMSEQTTLRLLNRFPPRELNKAVAQASAARLFVQDRLEQLQKVLHVPLTDEEIADLSERAAKALDTEAAKAKAPGDKEAAPAGDEKALRTDWRSFDRDASGYLDAREVAALVRELRQQPDQMLFRQFLGEDAEWQSHPTMRRRILHLHELFAKEREIVAGRG